MELVVWMFVAMMTFGDGSVEEWPAEFATQEECEAFRASVPDWLDANGQVIGIVHAEWDEACHAVVIEVDHQHLKDGSI